LNHPYKVVRIGAYRTLVVVFVKHLDYRANVASIVCFDDDCQIAGAAIELTHMFLLFSDIALMAGAQSGTNPPGQFGLTRPRKKPSSRGLLPAWLPFRPHPAFAEPPCPGRQVGVGVSPSLNDL
jgi:hypothetical protein